MFICVSMWGMYIGTPHILTELLLEGFLLFIHGVSFQPFSLSFFLALCRLSGKSHPYVQFLIWLPWTNAGEAVSRCYFRIKLLHGFLGWQHQWKGRVRASTVHHPFLHTLLSDLTQSCSSNSLSWVQLFPSEDQVASIFTGRWSDVLRGWCCRISKIFTREASAVKLISMWTVHAQMHCQWPALSLGPICCFVMLETS